MNLVRALSCGQGGGTNGSQDTGSTGPISLVHYPKIVLDSNTCELYHSTIHMNDVTGEERLDHTLTALADPTRRAILERLTRGEARVTDLAAPFPISLNAVSKHIQMLERAGLVRRRRVWREHFLSFNPGPLEEAMHWIEQQRAFWLARLDALEAVLQAEESSAAAASEEENKKGDLP